MPLSDERIQELLARGEYDASCECRCAYWKLKSLAAELAQEVLRLRKGIGEWQSTAIQQLAEIKKLENELIKEKTKFPGGLFGENPHEEE